MTDTTLKDWYMRYAPRSPLPAPRSPGMVRRFARD